MFMMFIPDIMGIDPQVGRASDQFRHHLVQTIAAMARE